MNSIYKILKYTLVGLLILILVAIIFAGIFYMYKNHKDILGLVLTVSIISYGAYTIGKSVFEKE